MDRLKPFLIGLVIGLIIAAIYIANMEEKVRTEIIEKEKIRTVIKRVREPNGRETEVVVIDESRDTRNTTEITKSSIKTNISVLAATRLSDFNLIKPTYGLSVSRPFLGPITIGLFGYTDKTVGLSLGVNF